MHARAGKPTWTWAITIIIFLIIMWLSTVPNVLSNKKTQIPTALESLRTSQKFESVESIIIGRCSMCHAS